MHIYFSICTIVWNVRRIVAANLGGFFFLFFFFGEKTVILIGTYEYESSI